MANNKWNVDLFSSDLSATLLTDLSGAIDTTILAWVVSKCAAIAEKVCCDRPIACTAGCPHCCVLNVAILLPEGVIIADWMREQFPLSELDAIRKRLAIHRAWVRWMDDEERIAKHAVCPLLDATGHCSIYPVRPMVCRAVASLDRNSCQAAFSPVFNDETRLVLADLLRQAVYDSAFTALAQALRHHGLDDRSIELCTGIMTFLEHPEFVEQLLCGEMLPGDLWL